MVTRAIAMVILLAARLCAADSDYRAGLWEGTLERGRGIERIVLLLTVSAHGRDGRRPVTTAVARLESGSGTCGANQVEMEPNHVVFNCMTIRKEDDAETAGGRFEGYFSPGSNLVSGTWRGASIQLTRPERADSLRSEDDWVAEYGGQTCVVRVFDPADPNVPGLMRNGRGATIDIYSKDRAVFGEQIGLGGRSSRGLLDFGWTDKDKNYFRGRLNADASELTGTWSGADFLCGGPNHMVTFHRTPSSL